jgi:chromosome segregation ATPase
MSESEEQHQQSSDFPTVGYEAAEEERKSLKEEEEERNVSVTEEEKEEEESSPESATQQKRSERRGGGKRHSNTTTIATAASAWQVTLFDLDKQLNKQSRLMERMSDDIRHLRKQFNQVQRDLSKFEKRMQKMKTITPSSSKRGKRRG